MEKDIDEIKNIITEFIEKYAIKALKVNTKIECHAKINNDNPKKWIIEQYSKVNDIDVNLIK